MPLPSRAEHEVVARRAPRGLLLHLDVGHAVLGEEALLLGDEQRRRVGQRDEAEIGLGDLGPAACATCAPNGNCVATAASKRARAGGLEKRAPADAAPWSSCSWRCCFLSSSVRFAGPARRVSRLSQQKSRSPRRALCALPQSGGVACRPVIGPAAPPCAAPIGPSHYKWRAKSVARKKRCGINAKKLIAEFCGSRACCRFAHSRRQSADSLCSAKN